MKIGHFNVIILKGGFKVVMTIGVIEKKLLDNRVLLEKNKVKKIGVFGSALHGKQNKSSDVDIIVEFHDSIDLFQFVHLATMLKGVLKKKVDLVTPAALKPYIRDKVLNEVHWLAGY